MIAAWAPWWVAAYFVGSIPAGFLIARAKGVDIRNHGSGNIGATNVWRVLGPRLGALCFVIDVLKGLVPVLAAGAFNHTLDRPPSAGVALAWMGVSAAAIAGHMFPVWLKFKGGKGVATGLGALAGVWPVMSGAALGALVVWIIAAKLTKYVGISSCFAAASMPVWVLVAAGTLRAGGESLMEAAWAYLVVSGVLTLVVIYKHRGNIRRTLDGTESRIGQRVTPDARAASPTPPSQA